MLRNSLGTWSRDSTVHQPQRLEVPKQRMRQLTRWEVLRVTVAIAVAAALQLGVSANTEASHAVVAGSNSRPGLRSGKAHIMQCTPWRYTLQHSYMCMSQPDAMCMHWVSDQPCATSLACPRCCLPAAFRQPEPPGWQGQAFTLATFLGCASSTGPWSQMLCC